MKEATIFWYWYQGSNYNILQIILLEVEVFRKSRGGDLIESLKNRSTSDIFRSATSRFEIAIATANGT